MSVEHCAIEHVFVGASEQQHTGTVQLDIDTHTHVTDTRTPISSVAVDKAVTVQPVATCRHSPYVHKPAIVKLLLLIYGFKFTSGISDRLIS